jgi:NAD(P)-dependent dehydrogenase (short-subunit alcohol dehydrogenase family)
VVASRSADLLAEVVAEVTQHGGEALAVITDVTDPEQCKQAVERAVERFGQLDLLICSAGVSMRAPFASSDLMAMEQVMRVNFFGTLYATHHALPSIRKQRGSLVAISSLTGKRGVPTYAIYGASKFAVQGLYESLRLELESAGIHVGVVSPGHVDTPLRSRVLGPDGRPWKNPPQPPFRVWPVEKCVDRVIGLIVHRQAEALLPGIVRPLLAVEQTLGTWVGDWFIRRRFGRDPAGELAELTRELPSDCDIVPR